MSGIDHEYGKSKDSVSNEEDKKRLTFGRHKIEIAKKFRYLEDMAWKHDSSVKATYFTEKIVWHTLVKDFCRLKWQNI